MAGRADIARANGRKGGRPKGSRSPYTLEKEAARELVRQRVFADLGPLMEAQLANAKGIKFLVVREKATGKFLRVGEGRAEKLNPEEEIVEIWEKDPSVQAFTDLMNRALDKPKEQPQDVHVTGQIDVVTVLKQRHTRSAELLGKVRIVHQPETHASGR